MEYPGVIVGADRKRLLQLVRNPYPGRGIIIGTSEDGGIVQLCWIMGRRENSRNRVFGSQGGRLFTEAADPAKVKDPALIIYNAMSECGGGRSFVVSNGDQTDTVVDALRINPMATLRDALFARQYEPDFPDFTSRITGLSTIHRDGRCTAELSLIRKSELVAGDKCERSYYDYYNIARGCGFCITTYQGDGDPLPSFEGGPIPVPLVGDVEWIADNYWRVLNQDNRVSLAVKFINLNTRESQIKIINKYEKVA